MKKYKAGKRKRNPQDCGARRTVKVMTRAAVECGLWEFPTHNLLVKILSNNSDGRPRSSNSERPKSYDSVAAVIHNRGGAMASGPVPGHHKREMGREGHFSLCASSTSDEQEKAAPPPPRDHPLCCGDGHYFENLKHSIHKRVCKAVGGELLADPSPHRLEIPLLRVKGRQWQWHSQDVGDAVLTFDREMGTVDADFVCEGKSFRLRCNCRDLVSEFDVVPFFEDVTGESLQKCDPAVPSMRTCTSQLVLRFKAPPIFFKRVNSFVAAGSGSDDPPLWVKHHDFTGGDISACREFWMSTSSTFVSDEELKKLLAGWKP